MFALLLVVLVAMGLAGAGLLGIGALSSDRRRERTGLLAAVSAPVVLIVGLAVAAVVVLGVGGGREEHGDSGSGSGDSGTRPVATTVAGAPQTVTDARLQPVTNDFTVVPMDASWLYHAVGGLQPGVAVLVNARGFEGHESGIAEQCVTELGRNIACGPSIRVNFDGEGRADFLFVVRGDIAPGGCRSGGVTCLLRVRTPDREATTQTVLVDPWVPGEVRAMAVGEGRVEVAVTGFPAGSRAAAVLCAQDAATYDTRRCSTEALVSFAVNGAGSGAGTAVVEPGRVGAERVSCGPRSRCVVLVLTDTGYVAAPAVPVAFADGPGVGYDADRVLVGVAVAVVLLGVVVLIAVRTDWTKPTEAATPEMDGSDLQVRQSLDDLFGTDAELDAKDPIPW